MNNSYVVGAVVGILGWLVYFQIVDFLLMKVQGLDYFKFVPAILG